MASSPLRTCFTRVTSFVFSAPRNLCVVPHRYLLLRNSATASTVTSDRSLLKQRLKQLPKLTVPRDIGGRRENGKSHDDDSLLLSWLLNERLQLKAPKDVGIQKKGNFISKDYNLGVQKLALENMRDEIRVALDSSYLPKTRQFMFLRPHYEGLKSFFEGIPDGENKKCLADIISALSTTMSKEGEREILKYKLQGSALDIGYWGIGYLEELEDDIGHELSIRKKQSKPVGDDIMNLVKQIVAFYLKHDANDFLSVVLPLMKLLPQYIEKENFNAMCSFLTKHARFWHLQKDLTLHIAYQTYMEFKQYPDALRVALRMDSLPISYSVVYTCFFSIFLLLYVAIGIINGGADKAYDAAKKLVLIKQTLSACDDVLMIQQLCYILTRQDTRFEIKDYFISRNEDNEELLQEFINNKKLRESYLAMARHLDVMEPKILKDVFKADDCASAGDSLGSTLQNLATIFVNAFVNAGFGQDISMIRPFLDGSASCDCIFQNKDYGKITAIGSLGLIALWNVDDGLSQLKKYLRSSDNQVVAGALLGVGILNSGIHRKCHTLYAEFVVKKDPAIRVGAIVGLGFAYAGSCKEEVYSFLGPIITDARNTLDIVAFSAPSLGIVYAGSCHDGVRQVIIHALMERNEAELGDPLAQFLCLGLGLLYLGNKNAINASMEVAKTLGEKISKYLQVTLELCAYVGTGDRVVFNRFQASCEKHKHHLQYGEQHIRRTVPLSLGLLSISNPEINVIKTLSRLSNDSDIEVAMSAIIALGLVGTGTNNDHIAMMRHNLSSGYCQDSKRLFCVRIAQGLLQLGKGLLIVALSGLIIVKHGCMNMKPVILGKYHFILYLLRLAMRPRMLMTLDENLRPLSVPVCVKKGDYDNCYRDTVREFQTHTTPVLLATGYHAVLATEKYIPLSSAMDGLVILKEKPDFEQGH